MTVGVVGLGLIGGSVGLALRDPGRRVLGLDPSPEHERIARERFCVDETAPLEAVAACEIVFVCVPPAALPDCLDAVRAVKGEGTVITDVTSVKADAVAWARRTKEPMFVPGHPMAGHEKGGPALASAWLFRNARWILTPLKTTDKGAVKAVEEAVKLAGATPVRMDPAHHDGAVALLSHLPHALASALVRRAERVEGADVAAGSWRDLTRVAGAEPELWTQIMLGNREALLKELDALRDELDGLATHLRDGDRPGLHAWLDEAAEAHRRQSPPPPDPVRVARRGR